MVAIEIKTKREYGALFLFIGIIIIIISVIARFLVILLGIICLISGFMLIFDLDKKLEQVIEEWKRKKKD